MQRNILVQHSNCLGIASDKHSQSSFIKFHCIFSAIYSVHFPSLAGRKRFFPLRAVLLVHTEECRWNALECNIQSDFELTKDTPYLTLTGAPRGAYCENIGKIDRVIMASHCVLLQIQQLHCIFCYTFITFIHVHISIYMHLYTCE